MNFLYPIKDIFAHGYAVQLYVLFFFILVVAMTIKGIVHMVEKKNLSMRFGMVYSITSFLMTIFIAWLLILTPTIISPKLPLFEPLTISPDNPLTITFDRPVNRTLSLSIQPPVTGIVTVGYNTIQFTPDTILNKQVEYSVVLDTISIISKKNDRVLFVFKTNETSLISPISPTVSQNTQTASKQPVFAQEKPTETPTPPEPEFKLDVPLIKQTHDFTCFSAAARMALAYRGVTNVGEVEFIDKIGRDTTERNFVTNTWGDPNASFVGTLDGEDPGGYGSHWDPVARVLNEYRISEVKRNWTIPELLAEVENNNPVLVWWVNGVWPAKDVSWNLPRGGRVYTVNGMHVEVVTGWKGDRENPTLIYTNDPWRGYRTYNRAQFENLWKWFENTAVIVR